MSLFLHRFSQRDQHQVFLEPEGLDEGEGGEMGGVREGEGGGWGGGVVYPSGVSNCLPEDIQLKFLQKIPV